MPEEYEINLLSDDPELEDGFGTHEPIAEAIAKLICNEKTGGKCIGIEGTWGSGKSTIVNLLKRKLKEKNKRVCNFDAWAHQGDPLRVVFYKELLRCLEVEDVKEYNDTVDIFTGKLKQLKIKSTPELEFWQKLMLLAIFFFSIGIFLLNKVNLGNIKWADSFESISWLPTIGFTLLFFPVLLILIRLIFHFFKDKKKGIPDDIFLEL